MMKLLQQDALHTLETFLFGRVDSRLSKKATEIQVFDLKPKLLFSAHVCSSPTIRVLRSLTPARHHSKKQSVLAGAGKLRFNLLLWHRVRQPLRRQAISALWRQAVSHGRYVAFQVAEVAVPRMLFAEILRLIAELRPPPDPAPA
jgi:hypothetical protein